MIFQPLSEINLTSEYPTFDVIVSIEQSCAGDAEAASLVDEAQHQIFSAARAADAQTTTAPEFDPFVDIWPAEQLRTQTFAYTLAFFDGMEDNDYWWWLDDNDYPREQIAAPVSASPFDWLVTLLAEIWKTSHYAADLPTFDSFLADLRLIEYHSAYVGPVAVYRSQHRINDYGNTQDWDHVRIGK